MGRLSKKEKAEKERRQARIEAQKKYLKTHKNILFTLSKIDAARGDEIARKRGYRSLSAMCKAFALDTIKNAEAPDPEEEQPRFL